MKTLYILFVLVLVSCSKENDIQQETIPAQQTITPDIISGNWYVKSYDAGPWSGPIENFNPNDIIINFTNNTNVNVVLNTVLSDNSNFIYKQNTAANYTITQPDNKIILKNKPYFIILSANDNNKLYLDGNTAVDGDLITLIKI